MSEIAMRHNGAEMTPYQTPTSGGMARLADWAQEARAAATLAESLCRTSFVPKHFQGKPQETAAAILTGHELGLSPMAALRAIFVIAGTPGMYAKAMVAVVVARGHEVWIPEQSDERVTVCGRRKGSEHVFTTTWDRARVVKAKLTSNDKYQENPQQMMTARGQAEIARQVAPDALLSIPYALEELDDFDDRPVRAELTATERVTVAEIMGTDAPAEDLDPMITKSQQRKLHATLHDLGLGGREAGLAEINRLLDRPDNPITSTKELTKVDAGIVIDNLDAQLLARAEPNLDDDWPPVAEADGAA
jgi:hypothetical protein